MFPRRYFTGRFFAASYFPPVAAAPAPAEPVGAYGSRRVTVRPRREEPIPDELMLILLMDDEWPPT